MRTGIFFDLPEQDYHADPALGSHDLLLLLQSGPDYWWNSRLNPNYVEPAQTPPQRFGSALHKYILEGSQAFHARYVRRPDDLERLTAKIKEQLCPNGEEVLDGKDFDRIEISGALIAQNPHLATALVGGKPEVSVFWTEHLDGLEIPCKGRIDYLKARGVGDLKSIRNTYGRPFAQACRYAIANYGYDIQAAHYLAGRARFSELIANNQVYGERDPAFMARVVAAKSFAFQWIFYQAESAPNTWSRSLSPGNPVLDIGNRKRSEALQVYREYKLKFPNGEMWRLEEPVGELDINELPGYYR